MIKTASFRTISYSPLPAIRSFAAAGACLILSGCVTVPLSGPVHGNLIEHQIDQIEDYAPVPTRRSNGSASRMADRRQVSSRTLMPRGGSQVQIRPVSQSRLPVPPPPPKPAAVEPSSRWVPKAVSDKLPDYPDWGGIVGAIGPSSKSAARRTAAIASGTYSRGKGVVTGAARYAGSALGGGDSEPVGEYMVTARPGQVGAGGLCWPTIGKVSRGFLPEKNHMGIDICAPEGTPVLAARGGKVVYSGQKLSGFGNVVILEHGGGFATVYGHNSKNLVADGDFVRQGQLIALVGNTGRSTTPHCHFELRCNTQPIDPRPFLP